MAVAEMEVGAVVEAWAGTPETDSPAAPAMLAKNRPVRPATLTARGRPLGRYLPLELIAPPRTPSRTYIAAHH